MHFPGVACDGADESSQRFGAGDVIDAVICFQRANAGTDDGDRLSRARGDRGAEGRRRPRPMVGARGPMGSPTTFANYAAIAPIFEQVFLLHLFCLFPAVAVDMHWEMASATTMVTSEALKLTNISGPR